MINSKEKLKLDIFISTVEIDNYLALKDIKSKSIKSYIYMFIKLFDITNDDSCVLKMRWDESIFMVLIVFGNNKKRLLHIK